MDNALLVELTADIVSAHVANNTVEVGEIGTLVQQVHEVLAGLGKEEPAPEQKVGAVSIRASIKPDHIVCLECGAKQKTLKKHLQSAHGMSPEDYRRDYGLPRDYPLIAPDYAETRRALAKKIGLGRKPKATNNSATKPNSKPKNGSRARLKLNLS